MNIKQIINNLKLQLWIENKFQKKPCQLYHLMPALHIKMILRNIIKIQMIFSHSKKNLINFLKIFILMVARPIKLIILAFILLLWNRLNNKTYLQEILHLKDNQIIKLIIKDLILEYMHLLLALLFNYPLDLDYYLLEKHIWIIKLNKIIGID